MSLQGKRILIGKPGLDGHDAGAKIIALTLREDEEAQGTSAQGTAGNSRGGAADPIEGVFVIREGEAHFTPVQVGIAGQEYFEVISGLSLGDSVVSGPYQVVRTLEDGAAVRPTEDTDDDERDG